MARYFLPKMSFILTVLLFGFVATVYALKPESVSRQQSSTRLVNAPVYRIILDTAELAGEDVPAGPAKVLVAERSDTKPADEVLDGASGVASHSTADDASVSPASIGLMPKSDGQGDVAPASMPSAPKVANLELEELKDLGMASISSGGAWYTLQTAYVPASDQNTLNLRLIELSDALGSREGVFIYQTNRSEGVFYGVCVKRFTSAAQAKGFKKALDKKLGYPTQLRSQKGLQTEVGF
jgi:hypothetical protein